jgi:salicylate hydroxylase
MKASSPFRIVIVGGGIAGLTAAIALRAPNRRIVVLEQSRLNKEIGALISLQPNASKIAYDTFRLGSELEHARGMADEGFRIYSTDGELVNEIPLTIKVEHGGSRVVYHRRDLHDALKKAALSTDRDGEPVEIRVSSRVIGCDPWGGSVYLENGEKVEGDIIIGADGM